MKKLLLHVCCGPCSTHVIEVLKQNYDLTLFFYNPNVEPLNEYSLRLETAEEFAKKLNLPIIIGDYDSIEWHNAIKGHEQDEEEGERCGICFRYRLEKTAQLAKQKGFDIFTTTLTVSPFKNAEVINKIGRELAEKYSVEFLESDFKKENGYMHSVQLSKEHGLYRQHYCGCLYSKK
jgi:predicted adenine nucleotide alpha hydrolase (AANH) superfamily ATPase